MSSVKLKRPCDNIVSFISLVGKSNVGNEFICQKELKSLQRMMRFVYLSQVSKSIRDNGSNMQHTFREVNEDKLRIMVCVVFTAVH